MDDLERAGFVERAVAWLIDLAVLIGIGWALAQVIAATAGWGAVGITSVSPTSWQFTFSPLFTIVVLGAVLFHNVSFWCWGGGATLGKRVFGLRVVRADGRLLSVMQAVGRSFAYLLSLPFLVGFLWAALDRRHQAFHDKLAETVVIRGP